MWIRHSDSMSSPTLLVVKEVLAQKNILTIPHLPNSPDLAPCDPKSKPPLGGHHFGTVEKVQAAVMTAFSSLSQEDILHCYDERQHGWNHYVHSH